MLKGLLYRNSFLIAVSPFFIKQLLVDWMVIIWGSYPSRVPIIDIILQADDRRYFEQRSKLPRALVRSKRRTIVIL